MPGSDRPNVLKVAQSVCGAWPTIPALMRLMSSQATFEPVSAKTQPVSGHTTCQIPDIENSCSRDSSRKTPPSVYYEPLRHPKAPGLSLAGFQLVIALTTPWGFPCFVRFPCVHAVATTPAQRLGVLLRSLHPDVSVFPDRVVGSTCASSFSRLARRSLALRPAHSRCRQFVTR